MPIDFGFTEEQELFRRTLKDYFAKNLTPKVQRDIEGANDHA